MVLAVCGAIMGHSAPLYAQAQQESGSIGLEGRISAPPPATPATITVPGNGATFTQNPVTVSGLCPGDVLVKIFKNNVFAGSTQCVNGSYSLQIDLFIGSNDLVARVYDALDQAGPDSNIVSVTYRNPLATATSLPVLSSNYAKRGANPGQKLIWPIILTGGTGPYAISVDWGDGKPASLQSLAFAGTFNIEHTYDNPGAYSIVIKATDKDGNTAFLQLMGVANGPLSQENSQGQGGAGVAAAPPRILWQPAAILIPFLISTFWLGKRYELHVIKKKIERGERPF